MKNVLLKIAAAAASIALVLCIAIGFVLWYTTRPKPPKPWNTIALTASDAPSFNVYGEERHIHLRYEVQNHTSYDYSLGKANNLRVMGRYPNGTLTDPLEDNYIGVEGPVFIPAQHTGAFTLEIKVVQSVAKDAKQSDEEYHEQIRALLNKVGGALEGITIFDEGNRYQINLPRWYATKPADKSEAKTQPKS